MNRVCKIETNDLETARAILFHRLVFLLSIKTGSFRCSSKFVKLTRFVILIFEQILSHLLVVSDISLINDDHIKMLTQSHFRLH